MKFQVEVLKTRTSSHVVLVDADDAEEAIDLAGLNVSLLPEKEMGIGHSVNYESHIKDQE